MLLPDTGLDFGVPEASRCNCHLLTVTAPRKGGSQLVCGHPLWSPSERRGNSESAAGLIPVSHLLFGRDSHLTHLTPQLPALPPFTARGPEGTLWTPDIPTSASDSPLGCHPLFQASKQDSPVNTSVALRDHRPGNVPWFLNTSAPGS